MQTLPFTFTVLEMQRSFYFKQQISDIFTSGASLDFTSLNEHNNIDVSFTSWQVQCFAREHRDLRFTTKNYMLYR